MVSMCVLVMYIVIVIWLFEMVPVCLCCFLFSSRRRHTRCALVTGVQTCALPILLWMPGRIQANAPAHKQAAATTARRTQYRSGNATRHRQALGDRQSVG